MLTKRAPSRRATLDDIFQLWDSVPYAPNVPDFSELQLFHLLNQTWIPAGPFVVSVTDLRKKRICHLSRNVVDLLGYPADLLMREGLKFWSERIDADDRDRTMQVQREAFQLTYSLAPSMRQYLKFSFVHRMRHANGDLLWILQQSQPVYIDFNGSIVYVMNIYTDITPYKHDNVTFGTFHYPTGRDTYELIRLPSDEQFSKLLTKREREIIRMLMDGMSSKQIAESLKISPNTVNNHRKRLLGKTGCNNSMELVRYAIEQGLL